MPIIAFFSLPGFLVVLGLLLFLLPSSVVKRGLGGLANRLGRVVGNLAGGREHARSWRQRPRELAMLAMEEEEARRILGLPGAITPEELKRRWRELSRQYHPDQVHHLGPKLKAVAEREMKAINAAYDYLRKKYGA